MPKEYKDYLIQPISLSQVRIMDNFWAPRIKTNAKITIPHVIQKCEETGRIANFSRAAGLLYDGKRPLFPFDDSDVFKVIEGVAYSLKIYPDAKLEAYIDDLIEKVALAQEDDGYLYTDRTISPDDPHGLAGKKRWELVTAGSHELYNIGHLIEAGIVYFQTTGKDRLLNVGIKSIELISNIFGPCKLEKFPGHQEIELALIRLYRLTKKRKFLELAKFFLDIRGIEPAATKYNQAHKRIVEQDEAVGHAVRAVYMYSAIVDLISIYGDIEYKNAINIIWKNVISKKMYLTGGIGSSANAEKFQRNYKLPNLTAYAETCAAIANIFWNYRLFLLYEDAKYLDILERALYNGFLSGISLDGKKFAYVNPLASEYGNIRKPWWDCPCCPTNVVRFLPQLPSYIYGLKENTLFINLFIGSTATFKLNDTKISINQETDYPWDGRISLKINLAQPTNFTLAIRIPGWEQNKPVPSDLYSYLITNNSERTLTINNRPIETHLDKGFVKIRRIWSDNDIIELNLPMSIKRVVSNEKIKNNRGKVALERGPIVYCIENIDDGVKSTSDLILGDNTELKTEYRNDLLKGIITLTNKHQNFTAIPYYAWSNRGKSQMEVWIKRD